MVQRRLATTLTINQADSGGGEAAVAAVAADDRAVRHGGGVFGQGSAVL